MKFNAGQIETLVSSVKGRAKARNALAHKSKGSYLLFIDSDVELTDKVLTQYIKPAFESDSVVAYMGFNRKLCTRIFGIPRNLFYKIGGFDETFDLGEDIEIGFRLEKSGIPIKLVPKELVKHLRRKTSFSWSVSYLIRARLAIRYHAYHLLLPINRKNDAIGFPLLVAAFYRYFFRNARVGAKS